MRRPILIVLCFACVLSASAANTALAVPAEGVVASFFQDTAKVTISAAGDPATEVGSGFIINRLNPHTLFYRVRVTCLVVDGAHAVIGGEIVASDVFPGHVGSGLVFDVEDVGEPGRGADQAGHNLNVDPQPLRDSDCPTATVLGPAFAIDMGNIQVFGG
jgi:hypothetical protein